MRQEQQVIERLEAKIAADTAKADVLPYTFKVNQFSAVMYNDALAILGADRFARLIKDPVRGLGPIEGTVYPWNIEAYLIQPNLGLKQ